MQPRFIDLFRSVIQILLILLLTVSCTKKDRKVVLVKVGEHSLMSNEFASLLANRIKQFNVIELKNPQTLSAIKTQVVNEFINESLFKIWASQNDIKVPETEVLDELKKIKNNYKTDLSFKEALTNSDATLKQLRSKIRISLLKKKVFDKLKKNITPPSEGDIKSYFEANKEDFKLKPRLKIEQIILTKQEDADLTYEQLVNGNIPEKVKQNLEHHWIYESGLQVFEEAFKMELNEWSPVLKSEYGYHIYRVLLKEDEKYLSFEKAKDLVKDRLLETRQEARYSDWLEDMLGSVEIFKNDEALKNVIVEAS